MIFERSRLRPLPLAVSRRSPPRCGGFFFEWSRGRFERRLLRQPPLVLERVLERSRLRPLPLALVLLHAWVPADFSLLNG